MSAAKTINVRDVYLIDSITNKDGLVLEFRSAKYRVRVHMPDFMTGSIGSRMHEHLNRRQSLIDAARKKLRGEA